MEGEHGFTLIELVVAVAIAVLLLAAGGAWMLGMHPGALRSAVNDVDADLDAARAIASSSGNGATLAFLPRAGRPGFEVRVYSGRPTRAGTVTPSTVMFVESDASVREATFGAPPFAIFLSSAGTPSGMGAYPQVAGGVVSFPAVAAQPPCPASGAIVLTFANAQGARDTRTLRCDGVVVGSAVANPPPSPNPLRLSPAIAVAHWTRDAYPLQFAAAEYGYAQWIASATGTGCATRGSDTGGAPAIFPSPWPYRTPGPSASANPPPPNAPYTYPDLAVPDDPPARFALQPVAGNGGICEVRVSDAFGQTASSQVQVMGDLTPAPRTLTFASPHAAAQRLLLAKTWDNEPLALAYGGDCANIVATTTLAASTPSVASATPATVTLDVAPRAAGTCAMEFTDQYREPWASIAVTVKSPPRFATWPQQLSVGANGAAVAQTTSAASYTGACYAQARTLAGGVDTSLPLLTAQALGVQVASDGCILNADASGPYGTSTGGGTTGTPTGVMIAYEPVGSGQSGTYSAPFSSCSGIASVGTAFQPNLGRNVAQASLSATGKAQGSCIVDLSDGTSTQTPAPDAGQVAVMVNGCPYGATGAVTTGDSCAIYSNAKLPYDCAAFGGGIDVYYGSFSYLGPSGGVSGSPVTSSAQGTLTQSSSDDSNGYDYTTLTFSRSAPGAVTVYVYRAFTAPQTIQVVGGETTCAPGGMQWDYIGSMTID